MADYSEELADQVYAKFPDIDANQRRVWKTRNKIPDRYFKEGFQYRSRVQAVSKAEDIKQDRLAQVFSSEKLHRTLLWQVADMPGINFSDYAKDFSKGKVHLHEEERKRLVNAIQQLRVKVKNAIPEDWEPGKPLGITMSKKLLAVARDPIFKKVPMFGNDLGRKLAPSNDHKMFDEYSKAEYEMMIESLSIFLLESTF